MAGVFRFKSWFLNFSGFIHGGAYYRDFMVYFNDLSVSASTPKSLLDSNVCFYASYLARVLCLSLWLSVCPCVWN